MRDTSMSHCVAALRWQLKMLPFSRRGLRLISPGELGHRLERARSDPRRSGGALAHGRGIAVVLQKHHDAPDIKSGARHVGSTPEPALESTTGGPGPLLCAGSQQRSTLPHPTVSSQSLDRSRCHYQLRLVLTLSIVRWVSPFRAASLCRIAWPQPWRSDTSASQHAPESRQTKSVSLGSTPGH